MPTLALLAVLSANPIYLFFGSLIWVNLINPGYGMYVIINFTTLVTCRQKPKSLYSRCFILTRTLDIQVYIIT